MSEPYSLIDLTEDLNDDSTARQCERTADDSSWTASLMELARPHSSERHLTRHSLQSEAGPRHPAQPAAEQAPAANIVRANVQPAREITSEAAPAHGSETQAPRQRPKRKRCTSAEGRELEQIRVKQQAKGAELKALRKAEKAAEARARKAGVKAGNAAGRARGTHSAQRRVDEEGQPVRFRSSPPVPVKERMRRAMPDSGHHMFLLDRQEVSSVTHKAGPVEEFAVLGAVANVYTVTVGKHPKCTCPDFEKGNICKHYLFIMLRVLKLGENDPVVWQKHLLLKEAQEVLRGDRSIRPNENVLAEDAVIRRYRRLSNRSARLSDSSAGQPDGLTTKQRPVVGECQVCYEPLKLEGKGARAITYCQECGNNIHVECLKKWSSNKPEGTIVSCIYCRCPWPEDGPGGLKSVMPEYLNLKDVSQQHQRADTSLEALYGDTAVWIKQRDGRMARRQAANLYRLSQAS